MNTLIFASGNRPMVFNNKKITATILMLLGIITLSLFSYLFLTTGVFIGTKNSVPVAQQIDQSLSQHSQTTIVANGLPQEKPTLLPAAQIITGCSLELTTSKTNPVANTTTYTVDIKNVGTQICQNTSMSTYYASNEKLVSSTPKAKASNYWVLGQLASQATVRITFTTNKDVSNQEQTESCITADNAREDACTTYKGTVAPPSNPELPPIPVPPTPPVILDNNKENGVWVWKSPLVMDQNYRDFIINSAQQNNINVIYVTIDDSLPIALLPEGTAKNDQKKQYMDALELLVKQANQKGVSIDAEAGWKDWAQPENIYKPFAIVDFVKEYNATRTYKLRSLQYDVEPYLMSTYEKNKATLLKNFAALIDQTVTRLQGSNIAFAIVIPHFYDDAQSWTPSFTYNNKNTFTFNHLLNILERKPGSSIILMSYRNFANGQDSTIEISKVEIQEATSGGYKTQVIVAQETGNVDPDYVTFFGTSKNYFTEQTNIVKQTFLPYKNFGGMATHYLEPFLQLK